MKIIAITVSLILTGFVFSQEEKTASKNEVKKEQNRATELPISKSEGKIIIREKKRPMASGQKSTQKVAIEPKKQKQQKK